MPSAPPCSSQPASELWFVDGRAYDLVDWIEDHPGGREALMFVRGTNCTELFVSYHLMRGPGKARLAKYEVEVDRNDPVFMELLAGSEFTFENADFYKTVEKRVRKYFRDNKKAVGASPFWQAVGLLGILTTIALAVPAYVYGSIWAAVALGLVRAMTSVGPGHSMSHFCLFPRGNWNSTLFRLASPFLVSTWSIWTNTHVRSHHVDTLTAVDLQDNYPLKRIQSKLAHRSWHRLQHFYIWPVYLFALPLWALQDFLESLASLFSSKDLSYPYPLSRRVENVLAIAFNLFFMVALPFCFLDWRSALLVSLISNAVSSPLVVLQIVVNHEVTDTMHRGHTARSNDWGEHQVLTSHNYGVNSLFALHMSGGLNMQVEHHLFPRVHYTHYPALSEIVQEACVEFGLPYHASPHIFRAIQKHYGVLKLRSVP